MNVANLQLEGLLVAIASINNVLVAKGLLSADDIDAALGRAEASMTGDERVHDDLSPSHRDAICFPIRLLKLANRGQTGARIKAFSELARQVAQTKGSYNDQM